MSLLRKFLRSIYVPPEERLIKMVLDHASYCKDAASYLKESVESMVRGLEAEKKIVEVERAEREADRLRREILDYLAEGALPPLSREDFVRLTERVDMIADWSREACRILKALDKPSCLAKVGDTLIRLAEHAEEAAIKLYEAIGALSESLDEARKLVAEVERIEDLGDKAYAECLTELSRHWSEINNPLVLVLIEDVENVVDAAEDASDVLEEIIIRALR